MASSPLRIAATIQRPRSEVYAAWRHFPNLAFASRHLKRVEQISPTESEWTAEGPMGDVKWRAEIVEEVADRQLVWETVGEATVKHRGMAEFEDAPAGRGTEVLITLDADIPGGALGQLIAQMTGNSPEQEIAETLRRFKSLLECGEIATVEGQPSEQMRGSSKPGDLSKKVGLR
jgi:uncharacterized membrane protein